MSSSLDVVDDGGILAAAGGPVEPDAAAAAVAVVHGDSAAGTVLWKFAVAAAVVVMVGAAGDGHSDSAQVCWRRCYRCILRNRLLRSSAGCRARVGVVIVDAVDPGAGGYWI